MSESAACSSCLFFEATSDDSRYTPGECRRYPPQAYVEGRSIRATASWPQVYPADWCGEYRLDLGNGNADSATAVLEVFLNELLDDPR